MKYISDKYVRDPETNEKRTRLYAYGVSLGAIMLSLYLGKAGKRANEVIDGSVIFSSVWNMSTGMPVFYKTAFGFWTYMLGKNHTGNIKKMLPRLKSLMPK